MTKKLVDFEERFKDWKTSLRQVKNLTQLKAFKRDIIGPESKQLTCCTKKFKHQIFDVSLQSEESFIKRESAHFDFESAVTIFVNGKLLAFMMSDPVKVWSYGDASDEENLTRTELQALPVPGAIRNFALCVFQDRFVLLTGGIDRNYTAPFDTTYLFDS